LTVLLQLEFKAFAFIFLKNLIDLDFLVHLRKVINFLVEITVKQLTLFERSEFVALCSINSARYLINISLI